MVKIFQLSGENIKEYLINCAALLRYLVENDKKKITEKELEELLLNNFYQEKKSSDTCHLCSDKLVYINKKWRCPKCETYCLKCGLIITKEDEKCPKCGAKTK
ncbi:MAG: hypothetical protein KJ583_02740 [Nanoarchaeota archaeon]|nr:hypothetical protein [Nanoarchaeota archaeon]